MDRLKRRITSAEKEQEREKEQREKQQRLQEKHQESSGSLQKVPEDGMSHRESSG
jgi:hypothetical protein